MASLPEKDPAERKIITFDFSKDAVAITSAAITATVIRGKKDASAQAIVDGGSVVDGALVRQFISGGQDGSTYNLRCVANDADGEIHVAVGQLPVQIAE